MDGDKWRKQNDDENVKLGGGGSSVAQSGDYRATLSGKPASQDSPAPQPLDPATGMHGDYWIISDEERAKGFVRPVRESYRHLKCGNITTMNRKIAESYAANPSFYNATFCAMCHTHLPVGADGEFVWLDGSKVGT